MCRALLFFDLHHIQIGSSSPFAAASLSTLTATLWEFQHTYRS